MVSGDGRKEFESCHKYMVDGFFLKGWPLERACAMIESLLRRVDWERGIVVHNDLRLDGMSLTIFRNSKPLAELSPDQFTFLSLLITKAPAFVAEDAVVRHVFGETCDCDKVDAIKMLAHRLRQKLGPVMGRRLKCARNRGWVYLQPRPRPATTITQPQTD
jgi:DNA-binding response OmpR family regulator